MLGAPSAENVVAAPRKQILLPLIAGPLQPGRAAVLGPTYAEHARAAGLPGHEVREVGSLEDLTGAALVTVVHPNNPCGRALDEKTVRSEGRGTWESLADPGRAAARSVDTSGRTARVEKFLGKTGPVA